MAESWSLLFVGKITLEDLTEYQIVFYAVSYKSRADAVKHCEDVKKQLFDHVNNYGQNLIALEPVYELPKTSYSGLVPGIRYRFSVSGPFRKFSIPTDVGWPCGFF